MPEGASQNSTSLQVQAANIWRVDAGLSETEA